MVGRSVGWLLLDEIGTVSGLVGDKWAINWTDRWRWIEREWTLNRLAANWRLTAHIILIELAATVNKLAPLADRNNRPDVIKFASLGAQMAAGRRPQVGGRPEVHLTFGPGAATHSGA